MRNVGDKVTRFDVVCDDAFMGACFIAVIGAFSAPHVPGWFASVFVLVGALVGGAVGFWRTRR